MKRNAWLSEGHWIQTGKLPCFQITAKTREPSFVHCKLLNTLETAKHTYVGYDYS